MSTAPVLSPRALQELMRGNHKNSVSIKVESEAFLQVHRPVAMRFSPVWNRDLQNRNCNILTVTFPPDPPVAPLVSQSAPNSGNTPVTQNMPPPPPPPSNKTTLKFVVQWMERGGADPNYKNAVPYPKGYRAGLEKLLAIASMLQVSELISRVNRDLGIIPTPRPKNCSKCRKVEHPGQDCEACWECHEVGHRKANCPKAHQAYLERVARREQKAERERQRLEWEEYHRRKLAERKARREREEKERIQHGIRTGQVAVGDNGTTIWRWL